MSEFLNAARSFVVSSARVLLFAIALVLFGAGGLLAFSGKESVGAFAAGVACLFFAFISSFKALEGFGVRAETRAELEGKIREADSLLSELRGLVAPLSEMLFSVAAHAGRWASGMPRQQKHELMRRLKEELGRCGMTPDQMSKATETWRNFDLFDLTGEAIRPINEALSAYLQKSNDLEYRTRPQTGELVTRSSAEHDAAVARVRVVKGELDQLKAIPRGGEKAEIISGIRSVLRNSAVLSDDEKIRLGEAVEDDLLDIEHYQRFGEFRRLHIWMSRDPMAR